VIFISVLTSPSDVGFEDINYMVLTIFSIMALRSSKPHSMIFTFITRSIHCNNEEFKTVKHNYNTLYPLLLQRSTDGTFLCPNGGAGVIRGSVELCRR